MHDPGPAGPGEERPTPPSPAVTLALEVAEEAGARFDELCGHVAERREFADLRLEPVRPLPMSERAAGTLVWSRRAKVGGAGDAGFTIFYCVLPGTEDTESPRDGDTPVVGLRWSELAYAEPVRGVPRALLLFRADAARFVPPARAFGDRLRALFETEPD